jgi:hypothetical protein
VPRTSSECYVLILIFTLSALDTVLAESADAGAARVWCQRAVIISAAALIVSFVLFGVNTADMSDFSPSLPSGPGPNPSSSP